MQFNFVLRIKKFACCLVNFTVPANHRVKIKESQKRENYLELRKLWNTRLTVIPVVTVELGTISKGGEGGLEELEIGERVETIQTTALIGQNT